MTDDNILMNMTFVELLFRISHNVKRLQHVTILLIRFKARYKNTDNEERNLKLIRFLEMELSSDIKNNKDNHETWMGLSDYIYESMDLTVSRMIREYKSCI